MGNRYLCEVIVRFVGISLSLWGNRCPIDLSVAVSKAWYSPGYISISAGMPAFLRFSIYVTVSE